MPDNDGFLSRWSRRKLSVKDAEEARATEAEDQAVAEPDAVATDVTEPLPEARVEGVSEDNEAATTDEAPSHPAAEIDIESLTKESDYTVFMQKAVPVAVRRQALRKLWLSDPVLANLDGLNDYEDMEFTYGISDVATTDWKLGRGFLADKDLGLEPEEEQVGETAALEADAKEADAEEGDGEETVAEAEDVADGEAEPETADISLDEPTEADPQTT